VAEDNTPAITGVHEDNKLEIKGVDNNDTDKQKWTKTAIQQIHEQDNCGHYEEQSTGQYNNDDDVSIKNKSPEETYVTLNDMNIIQEMNAGQLNLNPETGEDINEQETVTNHTYNLRPMPKRNTKYTITQYGQQSTIANPHMHIILTQMSLKEGIKNLSTRVIMRY